MLAKVVVKFRQGTGTRKIDVWASSLDDAIERVLNSSENVKREAIIYARVARMTIYEIKRIVEQQGNKFFARDSMRFFRQTLKDFSVNRWGDGKFLVRAQSFGGHITEIIYLPFTGELRPLK